MSQDFNKGKIYKITNDYNDEVYVGSTCDTLIRRFSYHKRDLKTQQCKNRKIYKLMNEIGFERFRIELIEDYPCQDKYQLIQREGHFIREFGTLNKKIEGRTKQEYDTKRYEDNKDKISEQCKKYRETNKLSEKITCNVCGSIISRGETSRHIKTSKHQELMKTILTSIIH